MFLNEITLENFRIFENRQTFELRPITILVGKNNSGKSTLLNVLKLFIAQAENYDSQAFSRFLDLSKASTGIYEGKDIKPVDSPKKTFDVQFEFYPVSKITKVSCASYFYFYTLFDNSKVQFTYQFDEKEMLDIKKIVIKGGDNKNLVVWEGKGKDLDLVPLGETKSRLTIKKECFTIIYKCLRDNKRIFYKLKEHFDVNDIRDTDEQAIFAGYDITYNSFDNKNIKFLKSIEKEVGEKVSFESVRLFFSLVSMMKKLYSEESDFEDAFEKFMVEFDGVDNDRSYKMKIPFLFFFLKVEKILKIMFDALDDYMEYIHSYFRFKYKKIGATRIGSKRYFAKEDKNINLLAKQLFDEYFDIKEASYILKDILGVADSIEVKTIEGFMKKVEICKSGKTYNLSDMGYGISQLMPLIINPDSNRSEPDSIPHTWLLSEPEANLHPSLQSKIADLVAYQYNKYRSTFIIETHSEYLIRKLQYLCKDVRSPLKPKDVIIHYFYHPDDKPFDEPQVKKITINEDGNLTGEFGSGFFDESSKIALDLWNMNTSQKN